MVWKKNEKEHEEQPTADDVLVKNISAELLGDMTKLGVDTRNKTLEIACKLVIHGIKARTQRAVEDEDRRHEQAQLDIVSSNDLQIKRINDALATLKMEQMPGPEEQAKKLVGPSSQVPLPKASPVKIVKDETGTPVEEDVLDLTKRIENSIPKGTLPEKKKAAG